MQVTTKTLAEIRRRNALGENDFMIAEALGISKRSAHYWRQKLGLPVTGTKRCRHYDTCRQHIIYTVWSTKTDEMLACGTAQACADILGFTSADTFQQMVCRALKGQIKKYHVEKVVENK